MTSGNELSQTQLHMAFASKIIRFSTALHAILSERRKNGKAMPVDPLRQMALSGVQIVSFLREIRPSPPIAFGGRRGGWQYEIDTEKRCQPWLVFCLAAERLPVIRRSECP